MAEVRRQIVLLGLQKLRAEQLILMVPNVAKRADSLAYLAQKSLLVFCFSHNHKVKIH